MNETARQIKKQDVEQDEMGELKLRKGVAKNRRITIEDEEIWTLDKKNTVSVIFTLTNNC